MLDWTTCTAVDRIPGKVCGAWHWTHQHLLQTKREML